MPHSDECTEMSIEKMTSLFRNVGQKQFRHTEGKMLSVHLGLCQTEISSHVVSRQFFAICNFPKAIFAVPFPSMVHRTLEKYS
jgi:hypothetical protein